MLREEQFARLVLDSMDAVGGTASLDVILQIIKGATNARVIDLYDKVADILHSLVNIGIVRRVNDEYQIVDINKGPFNF